MNTSTEGAEVIQFLKSVSTATRFLDFASEEHLKRLPADVALRIEELEDLLSRLSLEAEAILWRIGVGQELYKRGK